MRAVMPTFGIRRLWLCLRRLRIGSSPYVYVAIVRQLALRAGEIALTRLRGGLHHRAPRSQPYHLTRPHHKAVMVYNFISVHA